MLFNTHYRPIAIIIFLVFLEIPCFAQNSDPIYFVWAPDSCTIYTSPSLESSTIARLAYGDSLIFLQEGAFIKIPLFHLSESFKQDTIQFTKWLKVKLKSEIGYVLENQISVLKPFKKNKYGFESLSSYLKRVYGLIDSVNFNRDYFIGSSSFNMEVDSLSFLNESTFTTTVSDGCTNYKFEFKNLSLLNAYFFLNLDIYYDQEYYNMGTDQLDHAIYSLELEKIEMNVYFFKDMFSQNGIKMVVNSDGNITFGYYYCM
jgi:hypothetical protein